MRISWRPTRGLVALAVALSIAGCGIGWFVAEQPADQYRASAELLITPEGSYLLPVGGDYIDSRSIVAIAHSPEVAKAALTILGPSVSPATLVRQTVFRVSGKYATVQVDATDRSAAIAAQYADAMAGSLGAYVEKVSTTYTDGTAYSLIAQVTPAALPTSPVGRPLARDLIIGALGGLLLSGLVVLGHRLSGGNRRAAFRAEGLPDRA